ncbi:CHAT domain-containing protein [Micromonospora sp. NPDC047557]|uniref:CHAT domain-containing protein n=1 Tax=Micromonospora sp. NPDC047557 TaxID=3364250 RepID=UPI00371B019F
MASFFLRYHADDMGFITRMIDDALTARFGSDRVHRDSRFVAASPGISAVIERRLSGTTALIVVLGPQWRDDKDGLLGGSPTLLQQTIEIAIALRVPIIPILVGAVDPPAEADLPEGLRPLTRQQYRHVRTRTAEPDIHRLVDDLATTFGADTSGTLPTIPLIRSEDPARLFMPALGSRPATVVVDATDSTRYIVDVSEHRVIVDLRLPSKDEGYGFVASFSVVFAVTDPAEVVRRAVTDAVAPIRDFLVGVCEPIARRFSLDEAAQAEKAVNRQIGRDIPIPGGVTVRSVWTRLTLDEQGRRRLWEITAEGRWRSTTYGGQQRIGLRMAAGSRARLLVVRAPTQIPVGHDLSVDVRISSEGRLVHPAAVTARMASFAVANEGTHVTLTAHAPAGLHVEGPLQHTVLVMPDEDPAPVRFDFGARTPGLHRVDVTAWAGGTFLTEVSVEVSVADGGPFRDGQPKAAVMATPQARPGEVTMEVRFDGTRYTFQLRSDAALFAPVVESVTQTPNTAVENAIRELQQLAGGGSRYSARMTRELIRSAGIQLWSEMVPADVQDQFWQVGSDMSAFTIATDHDVVPWELLYPLSARHDAGFLVEQVPVVRRTYGQHRTSKLGLRYPRFVVPTRAPSGAYEEVAAIRAILGTAGGEPITKADELLTLINSGGLGTTNFACHNTFSPDGSFIDMDGGRFKPALLAEASIRRPLAQTGPLVFINACRSAGTAPTYTRMLGWAQQFMSSGAGAFVGTLWAVRSESSARFAIAFYESLAEGATLGAAALAARTEQQEDPLDPTWLAYSVYGDPFATAA